MQKQNFCADGHSDICEVVQFHLNLSGVAWFTNRSRIYYSEQGGMLSSANTDIE